MLNQIRENKKLSRYIHQIIEDAGLQVMVDEKLRSTEWIAVKMDDFYANAGVDPCPKSIDFIVTVDCGCSKYVLYLLELKNVKSLRGIDNDSIRKKFSTAVDDFITIRYHDIYLNDRHTYADIQLLLVSDPLRIKEKHKSMEDYLRCEEKRKAAHGRDSLKFETLLASPVFQIRGKRRSIKTVLPNQFVICKAKKTAQN